MDLDQPTLSAAEIADIARRIDRPVVLVGLMGVGKSSIGRRLANLLKVAFVDSDEAIEEAARLSISEIFERHGEPTFRDGERRVIGRLLGDGDPKVIATGGGAFCSSETRDLILDKGIAVWLDADIETLLERVSRKDNRPLLRTGDPRETLMRLKAEREPAYAEAPIHVTSGTGSHQRAVMNVLQGIAAWL